MSGEETRILNGNAGGYLAKRQAWKGTSFFLLIVVVSVLECLNYRFFMVVNRWIYIATLCIFAVDLVTCRTLKTEGLLLTAVTLVYMAIINVFNSGGVNLKYTCVFLSVYFFEQANCKSSVMLLGALAGIPVYIYYFIRSSSLIQANQIQIAKVGIPALVAAININIPCFMVFICMVMLAIYCKWKKVKGERLIVLAAMLMSIHLSYLYDCRVTIFTSLLLYFMMEIIPMRVYAHRNMILVLTTALFIVGCAFPFFVAKEYAIEHDASLFSDREVIWYNFANIVKSEPLTALLGIGERRRFEVSTLGLTMHNSFLEIAFSTGFIGVFLYWLITMTTMKRAYENEMDDKRCALMAAYICMLVFAFVNTAITREYIFIFYAMFLGLCNNQTITEEGDKGSWQEKGSLTEKRHRFVL